MSVTRINDNLPTTTKISNLSEQILEINGLVEKARFDVNEITQLTTDFGMDRKYLRDQSLGHTLSTYTGWTHLHAESGYSIWKFSPSNYTYNSLNKLYLDDVVLENRGEANSESDTTFNKVFLDAGSLFVDNTTEAGTEDGTSFDLMNDTSDYLYVGLSTTFAGISFEFNTRGSNYTNECEYWNGVAWTTIDISGATYVDDTSNFESDGRIYWDIPSNWATTTINSVSKYWVRISTSTTPVTTASAYIITPANSVISLLKLSSSEVLDEDWAWCSYGTSIYVTIRNAGQSSYEGNYYITSSSTSINKQNYFIHNHEFTADYEDSTYIQGNLITNFDDLADVFVSSGLTDGQIIVWDSSMSKWRNADSSLEMTTLDSLKDVMVSSGLSNGQVLTWDSGDQVWRNATISETMTHGGLSDMPDTGGTNSDHDSRYYTESETDSLLSAKQASDAGLTSLAGLTYTSLAFVKYSGSDTFTLDTNTYSLSTHTHTLDDLSNVMVSSGLVNNQVLIWDSGDSMWRNSNFTLDNLSDVIVSSGLVDGQILTWDSGDAIWRNKSISETILHSELSDMPDSGGINTDHDSRYWTLATNQTLLTGNKSGSFNLITTDYISCDNFTKSSHYTGFPDRTSTSLSWDDGTYTLTLTATNDPIWINGVSYSINTITKQLSIAQEGVSGLYWFWITAPGGIPQLNADTTPPGFDKCLVATVYWNTTTNLGIISDERHWMGRDRWVHEYLHQSVGARYASGMAGTFTDTTITIGIGEFYDEDIEHSWVVDITTVKVLYHNGDSDWAWDVLTTPYKVVNPGVDNSLRYNNGNVLATVDNNKYVNQWVFATADINHPITVVIGTAQYVTIALARTASLPSLGTLISAESKLIYKITYQNNGGTPDYIETTDYRSSSNLPSVSYVAIDHGSLIGLGDDDHPQYVKTTDTTTLDDLSDVMVSSGLIDGQVLTWDAGDAMWRNISPITVITNHTLLSNLDYNSSGHTGFATSSHTHTLDSLSDVMVSSSLIDGQGLYWDAGDGIWRNITPVEGVTNHALLSNLSYASSGHTGFEQTLTFSQSLSRSVNNITLLNDSTTPGNTKYYGTDGSGTKGWYTLSTSSTLDSLTDVSVASGLVTGQVLTWDSADATWRNILPVYSKSFIITNPTSSADSPVWRTPNTITITAVHVLCIDGVNIIGQLWAYDSNGANGTTVDVQNIIGSAGVNVNDDGSLGSSGTTTVINAGNYIGWKTVSVSGSVTKAIITFDYTINVL